MNRNITCLSIAALKNIALVTMIIDHVAAGILVPLITGYGYYEYSDLYYACRYIGRLAFPIYCYCLVEGFIHTSNVLKYLIRLLIFAVISELAFDMGLYQTFFHADHQNVFFTLFLGLLSIAIIDYFFKNYTIDNPIRLMGASAGFIICEIVAHLGKTDYSVKGVLVIVLIFMLHGIPFLPEIIGPAVLAAFEIIDKYGDNSKHIEVVAVLAIPLLLLYNGKKGKGMPKLIYYLAYPFHLLLIGIISMRCIN